jgi:hypothetical protein
MRSANLNWLNSYRIARLYAKQGFGGLGFRYPGSGNHGTALHANLNCSRLLAASRLNFDIDVY